MKEKKERKEKKKRVRHIAEKNSPSPLFCPLFFALFFHSHSAEFLQQAFFLFSCVFPCLIYCPWSLTCWKIQPTSLTHSSLKGHQKRCSLKVEAKWMRE
jgi:hypothetical protein